MKPTKPKKSSPPPVEEGWLPSPKLLRQLISIAPLSWYERLASIAVREGLIKTPTDWVYRQSIDHMPGMSAEEIAEAYIEDLGIEGHAQEVDLPLFWEQLVAADQVEISRDFSLELPLVDSDQKRREFLGNEVPLHIVMPSLGVTVKATAWEFLQALVATSHGAYHVPIEGGGWRRVPLEDDIETRAWAFEMLNVLAIFASRQAAPELQYDEYRHPLEEAARAILRRHGYLHGPCERCRRRWWLANEPKRRGRPSLLLKNCPACVAMIKREQSTARSRRARTKK